ncbi:MAG: NAD(P)/FAD-dependent oxidoreductase [Pseudomonadota bacterium]
MSLDRSRRRILIVGAGPTGLTLALELARHGFHPEIVDKKAEPSQLSRAVGINPRSLELLEPSGLTSKLIEAGLRLDGIMIFDGQERVGRLRFSLLHHRYNFLLSLPQNRTEELLVGQIADYGIQVRWNTEIETLDIDIEGVEANYTDGHCEGLFEYVIGCDGVGSAVRRTAGIAFPGSEQPTQWSVADCYVKGSLEDLAYAHLHALADGTAFFTVPIGRDRVRAVCSRPDVSERLQGFKLDHIARTGEFTVQVRQADTYRRGPIFLAGDAAHCHSPAGGRGMNLGIGDACVLANCLTEGRLKDYQLIRHPAGTMALKQSERLSALATMTGTLGRRGRNRLLGMATHMPLLERRLVYRNLSGLGEKNL